MSNQRFGPVLVAAILVGAILPRLPAVEPADLVVRSANVITVDPAHPRAQAFAVRAGAFTAVGDNAAMAGFIGPATVVLDLAGKTITPGFIDAHAHPGPLYPEDSLWAPVDCRPRAVKTIDDLVAALKRKADRTPPGEWVIGENYENAKLGRQPTRWDLDRASTQHPIVIRHYSGHERVCNSLALEKAHLTREVVDPPGGRFVRDDQGELTGLLEERAAITIATGAVPPLAETRAACTNEFRRFLSRGITTVGVAGTTVTGARLLENARTNDAPLRLYIALRETFIKDAAERKAAMAPDENGVRYGAIKVFHGGSVSAHTGWVTEPYIGIENKFGLKPARSQEDLNKLLLQIHNAGLQAWVHCNGDREIDMVVTAFEYVLRTAPRADARHRLEHCSVVTPELLQRIKAAGLVVVPHSYMWEHGDTLEAYDPKLWGTIHPSKSLLDLGIPRAGHSDAGVSTADPLMHIQSLVTRTSAEGKTYGPEQCISAEDAIAAWTRGGAFACFAEKQTGSIEPGKLADFVVLAEDPTAAAPDKIMNIQIDATYVGGRKVFAAGK
jgi:hypothetical protein